MKRSLSWIVIVAAAMLLTAASTRFGRLLLTESPEITGANMETISNATDGTWSFGDADLSTSGLLSAATGAFSGSILHSSLYSLFPGTFDSRTVKTANYTILDPTDIGKCFVVTNTATLTLPTAAPGFACSVLVGAATDVYVDANTGDQIYGLTDGAAQKIKATAAGAWVALVAVDATYWAPIMRAGAWVDDD